MNKQIYIGVGGVARAGKKDPKKELEDLKKAVFYLQRKVENLQK